jgi:hypothetical protein
MARVEFIIVANHVEAVNGLLYLSGGGWMHQHRRKIPGEERFAPNKLGVAVAVLVPWDETNQRHRLEVWVEDEDGTVYARVSGEVEVGRPPGLPAGADQRTVLGLNADIAYPGPGGYRVVAQCGDDIASTSYFVHDAVDQPVPPT